VRGVPTIGRQRPSDDGLMLQVTCDINDADYIGISSSEELNCMLLGRGSHLARPSLASIDATTQRLPLKEALFMGGPV
jgi:hypothetical protein